MLFVETIEICIVQLQCNNYIRKICNETNLLQNLMLCFYFILCSVAFFFWCVRVDIWHRVRLLYFPSVSLESVRLFGCWLSVLFWRFFRSQHSFASLSQ